jgi:hypothetical protein
MEAQIRASAREPLMRDTLYRPVSAQRRAAAFAATELIPVRNAAAGRKQRSKRLEPVAVELSTGLPPDESLYQRVLLMAACD